MTQQERDERIIPKNGKIEVGDWVVIVGARYRGRKGKVLKIYNEGTEAIVRGNFGAWGHRGRVERPFGLEDLSLYDADMDESTGEYH